MAIKFNGNDISTHSTFKAATASAAGGSGLVPAPAAGENTEYLRGDGTWATPSNTTYSVATTSANGLMSSAMVTKLNGIAEGANKTTYGTTAKALGTSSAGSATTVSRSDHVHALPALTSCTGTLTVAKGGTGATDVGTARSNLGIYNLEHDFHNMVAADSSLTTWNKLFVYVWNTYFVAKNKVYETVTSWIVNKTDDTRHTAVAAELSTAYSNLTGSGFTYATVIFERVPSRACMSVTVYPLANSPCMKCMSASANGIFENKTDNTGFANSGWYIEGYKHPTYTARTGKPTANQTPAFGGTATVSQITSDATGHVTGATDRTITIPSTLSNGTGTAGLIKTTSTVTSNSGYTACPVISGVPYYKDTNTTYTLSSFGITATSKELNYCEGVTNAIQTQLNGKAQKSHASTATTYGIGTASNYGHIKLSDTYSSKVSSAAAANGVGVSQNALYNAYSNILTNVILHNIVDAEFVVDNISIEPNAVATIKFENTQRNDGYSRCIMSVRLENATKNGAQSSACNIYNEQQGTTGQSYSTCLVRNMHASTKAVIRATARIIYVYDCGAGSFSSYFTPS